MLLFHIVILAIVQGITEFLPISSSGHLTLLHGVFDGENVQAQYETNHMFDIAVHVGTLLAVLLYFWKDVGTMATGLLCFHKTEKRRDGILALQVGVASVPVIIVGFLLHTWSPDFLSALYIVAWANIIYAVFLWMSDKTTVKKDTLENLSWKDALIIGASQALALIPGTSRSGVTMTAARFLGYNRTEAARFSMFLGMVAISGAGLLGALGMEWSNTQLGLDIGLAVLLSFVAALLAITVMMRWLARASFTPFVIYRLVFGVGLLGVLFLGG